MQLSQTAGDVQLSRRLDYSLKSLRERQEGGKMREEERNK